MLQIYRHRRRQALQRDRGASDNSEIPRTIMTQNYMNGSGSVFDSRQAQSLHNNIRSQSQRRNLDSIRMDQLVRQLQSERREEDQESQGNNNYDMTATLIEE